MTKKSYQNQLHDKDYKEISSKSYNILNYENSKLIKLSNGRIMYVINYQETKKGLNALTLVSKDDYIRSAKGKDLTKIKNAVIAYRGSEPIAAGQYKDTIKKHGKRVR